MAGRLYIKPWTTPPLDALRQDSQPIVSPNLAPRRPISIIRQDVGEPHWATAFWGLTPPWLKVLDHAPHCARAESLEQRPMFREAFHARRCLIPVAGVYVWKPQPRMKQPFLVTRVDRAPLLLAGVWCRYHTTLTEFNDSTALITVPSNALLTPLSDRFPAVIEADDAHEWLAPTTPDERAHEMLTPAPLELLGAFPVSRRVNDPKHQDWACGHPTGPMTYWHH
ncbi:SOS response-associated peptidase [Chromohalobacter canadensis]|uniref:SOS response-associated peptidase n=1 Tax=Chromohalobacter canadensis TaxID=141389 RepID=UPI0021BFE9E1|nr:SOS response-associated peptidase [Chromohalobacter canadensis]MCT8468209.1 SOS response-associated peptidase [Chromohalobacter canadensis]MCT8471264.1 SOS response-associated peptidase [Chromohalobacter canadensis]MCT8498717.1 SOS response-associated peptidase [Chromohalobacter canadensis]